MVRRVSQSDRNSLYVMGDRAYWGDSGKVSVMTVNWGTLAVGAFWAVLGAFCLWPEIVAMSLLAAFALAVILSVSFMLYEGVNEITNSR